MSPSAQLRSHLNTPLPFTLPSSSLAPPQGGRGAEGAGPAPAATAGGAAAAGERDAPAGAAGKPSFSPFPPAPARASRMCMCSGLALRGCCLWLQWLRVCMAWPAGCACEVWHNACTRHVGGRKLRAVEPARASLARVLLCVHLLLRRRTSACRTFPTSEPSSTSATSDCRRQAWAPWAPPATWVRAARACRLASRHSSSRRREM